MAFLTSCFPFRKIQNSKIAIKLSVLNNIDTASTHTWNERSIYARSWHVIG
jgi:hypothetical protein